MFHMTSTSSNILYGKCIFTHSEAATGRCSFKIDALKNFAVFTKKKHLCWGLFLIKSQAFRPTTLSKRESNTGVLLSMLQKVLRTTI